MNHHICPDGVVGNTFSEGILEILPGICPRQLLRGFSEQSHFQRLVKRTINDEEPLPRSGGRISWNIPITRACHDKHFDSKVRFQTTQNNTNTRVKQ